MIKGVTVNNGELSLILVGDTELDVQILKALFSGPVDTQVVEKMQVINKSMQDVVVVTKQAKQSE